MRHKLKISCPDGIGYNSVISVDGQNWVGVKSVQVVIEAGALNRAVIEIDNIEFEFDGQVEVSD